MQKLLLLAFILSFQLACKPSLSSFTTPTNLLGMLGKNPNLSQFVGLLNKVPSVAKQLGGKNPFTILAPDNNAISALGTDGISMLTGSKDGMYQLANILKKHIVPGKVSTADIAADKAKNLLGVPVNLGDAKIIGDAISADNGNILVLDKMLK